MLCSTRLPKHTALCPQYTHVYAHTHTRTYMCTHTHIHMHTCAHTCIYMHICIHTYIHIHTCGHAHLCIHINEHTHLRTHMYTHTYTHMHMHTRVHPKTGHVPRSPGSWGPARPISSSERPLCGRRALTPHNALLSTGFQRRKGVILQWFPQH